MNIRTFPVNEGESKSWCIQRNHSRALNLPKRRDYCSAIDTAELVPSSDYLLLQRLLRQQMLLLQPRSIAHFHPEPKIRMNIRTFDPVNEGESKSWCIQRNHSRALNLPMRRDYCYLRTNNNHQLKL